MDKLSELANRIDKKYEKFAESKTGAKDRKIPFFCSACISAQEISGEYDLGIALANDGMALGYVFSLYGLDVRTAKLGRKGKGASWNAIDGIKENDIENKKVILFDNDSITGRTLKKAAQEIKKYSPQYIDLLLMVDQTLLTVQMYKAMKKSGYELPGINKLYPLLNVREVKEIAEGIEIVYSKYSETEGRMYETKGSFIKKNRDYFINWSTKKNIPQEIRKIMTLESDFDFKKNPKRLDLSKLEKITKNAEK